MSLTWTTPAWMWPLLLVLAAGAVIWTVSIYGRSRPSPPAHLTRWLVILRSLALLLLVLAVAGPLLSRHFKEEVPARLVFLLEDSSSMGIEDGVFPGKETPVSRWQQSLHFATQLDSALQVRSWPGQWVFLRGNGISALDEYRLSDPVIPDPQSHGTNLEALLKQTHDRLIGDPVAGVLLVSDGQETAGSGVSRSEGRRPQDISALKQVSGSWDLLVAGAGDPAGAADRLIRDVRYPETVFAGDEIVIEWTLTHRFLDQAEIPPVTASLSENGTILRDTTFVPTQETIRLEMPLKTGDEGLRVLELGVSALDNERFLANNQVSMGVNVQRSRSRILVLADRPGWDLRFLTQAALAEPRLEMSVVYQAADGPVFADSLVTWTNPTESEDWAVWDGVVVLGWQHYVGQLDWSLLKTAVDNGLGLWVIPAAERPGTRQLPTPAEGLAGMLPVTAQRFRWMDGEFRADILAGASSHPVLNQVGSSALAQLPPLRRMVGAIARPQALVLLEARSRTAADKDSPAIPLLVVNPGPPGKVAWFGGQRLWELAFWSPSQGSQGAGDNAGGKAANRLIQNMLVWLAADDEESGLNFAGNRSLYREAETISLGAQWLDIRGLPVLDQAMTLILREQLDQEKLGPDLSFSMGPMDPLTGLAQVDLPPLPPGQYQIQLQGHSDPQVLSPLDFFTVSAHSLEETQVRQDQRRLRQLAHQRDGQYVSLEGEDALNEALDFIDQMDVTPRIVERRNRWDFWSGWPFLIMVVLLLGTEWFLRRRNGLL